MVSLIRLLTWFTYVLKTIIIINDYSPSVQETSIQLPTGPFVRFLRFFIVFGYFFCSIVFVSFFFFFFFLFNIHFVGKYLISAAFRVTFPSGNNPLPVLLPLSTAVPGHNRIAGQSHCFQSDAIKQSRHFYFLILSTN